MPSLRTLTKAPVLAEDRTGQLTVVPARSGSEHRVGCGPRGASAHADPASRDR